MPLALNYCFSTHEASCDCLTLFIYLAGAFNIGHPIETRTKVRGWGQKKLVSAIGVHLRHSRGPESLITNLPKDALYHTYGK